MIPRLLLLGGALQPPSQPAPGVWHSTTQAANRTSLMIPWSRFPLMPVEVLSAMPPQGLSVRLPRIAYYFSLRVRDESNDVRMR